MFSFFFISSYFFLFGFFSFSHLLSHKCRSRYFCTKCVQRRVYRVTWGPFLGVTIYRSRSRVTGHVAPLQDKRDFLSYADSRVMVS